MSEREEITLTVDLPEVVETPTSVEVRCGETAVSVHEYSEAGSGSWVVWHIGGGPVKTKGRQLHPSRLEAVAVAREYVQHGERQRLLRARLEAALAGGGQDA